MDEETRDIEVASPSRVIKRAHRAARETRDYSLKQFARMAGDAQAGMVWPTPKGRRVSAAARAWLKHKTHKGRT